MKIVHIRSLAIPDVKVVRFARFRDDRGYFTETFRKSDFQSHPDAECLQAWSSCRATRAIPARGRVRGLHFQWNPLMGKLVRTVAGRMIDLALDIRKGSPSFGKIIAYDMPRRPSSPTASGSGCRPASPTATSSRSATRIEYLCSGQWSPGYEAGISPLAADLDWSLCDAACKALLDRAAAGAAVDFRQGPCRPDAGPMARRSPVGELSLRPVGNGLRAVPRAYHHGSTTPEYGHSCHSLASPFRTGLFNTYSTTSRKGRSRSRTRS